MYRSNRSNRSNPAYGLSTIDTSPRPRSFVCPPNAKCAMADTLPESKKMPVSTNEVAGSSGMGLIDKPWFWPAVVVVGVVGFMALRDSKR